MSLPACLVAGIGWLAVAACGAAGGGGGGNVGGVGGNAGGGGPGHGGATVQGGASAVGTGGTLAANAGTTAAGGGSANGGSANGGGVATAGGGAAGGANGSPCPASGLLFCEDFEKLPAGPVQSSGPWTTFYNGPDAPTIVIDATTPAHSGTHSVMVHAPVTDFQSFLIYHDAAVLPRAQGDFYLRTYVRLGRDMADQHNTYLVMDRFAAAGAGAAVRLGEDANMLSLTVGGDAHGALSNNKFSQDGVLGAHLFANSWACLEGYFNSAQPEIDFWLDGVEIPDFHHTDWPADSYDALRFGFEKYAGPELDIWFDDIAIGATRIGCQ